MHIKDFLLKLLFLAPWTIFITSIILATLFFIVKKRGKQRPVSDRTAEEIPGEEWIEQESTPGNCKQPQISNDTAIEVNEPVPEQQLNPPSIEETQVLFEQFVHYQLEQAGFCSTIGGKGTEGLTSFILQSGGQGAQFAINCMWKQDFIKGRVEWAKSYELVMYRQYENESGIPVYVAVGIGGSPDHPQKLSFVPLKQVRSNVLTEAQLQLSGERCETSKIDPVLKNMLLN